MKGFGQLFASPMWKIFTIHCGTSAGVGCCIVAKEVSCRLIVHAPEFVRNWPNDRPPRVACSLVTFVACGVNRVIVEIREILQMDS
jgi:hypothetical protein